MRSAALPLLLSAAVVSAQMPPAASSTAPPARMRELLARGVAPAPVSIGLAFTLTISGGGRNILAGPWALRAPGGRGPLTLTLEEIKLASGSFEALARIRNDTAVRAGGLRLDILEISEGSSDVKISSPMKSRPLALASPLFFGDLEPGADAAVRFWLEPLTLSPDSSLAVIRGVVTGVVLAGEVELPDSRDPVAIDSDGEGRVLVADGVGQTVFQLGSAGNGPRKIDSGCPAAGIAVQKKTREIYVSCRDAPAVRRISSAGKPAGAEAVRAPLGPIRFGGRGSLYGAPGPIVRLEGESVAEEISSAAGHPLRASGFDAASDGTIWAVAAEPQPALLRIRTAGDTVALAGSGEGLGALDKPIACRVAPNGDVYVLEGAAGDRTPRVSVFDRSGNLARTFGLPPGQPVDLVFSGADRLEVLRKRDKESAAVTVVRTF